jgi:antitoxin (DNA-binding transcriptional repressor) of toxin-antitoxin stability system
MTKTVDLEVAQATLGELIANLKPDDDVVILQNQKPVAKLVATSMARLPRVPGMMKGKLTIIADDDEHLNGFEEYMP